MTRHPPYRYTLEISADRKTWLDVADRLKDGSHRTHELIVLAQPVKARYVRVTNHARLTGQFSVYDLRVFGLAEGSKPAKVSNVRVDRKADRRRIEVSWPAAEGATGYVLRWGVHPGELYSAYQTLGTSVELGLFSTDQEYLFQVDAFNDSGTTPGDIKE